MWLVWNWEERKNYHLRLIAGILCHTKYVFLMLDFFLIIDYGEKGLMLDFFLIIDYGEKGYND